MKRLSKILALVLAVVMVFTMLPAFAMAEEAQIVTEAPAKVAKKAPAAATPQLPKLPKR